jgi:hypothetical protein
MNHSTFLSIIQNKIQDSLLFCSTVGSFVYRYPDTLSCKDRDLIVVSQNTIKNFSYQHQNIRLDVQCFTENHFLDCLQKQHIFFLEAIFCPKNLQLLENTSYLNLWKFDAFSLKIHTIENLQKTFQKSYNLFQASSFQKGKKVFFHAYRVFQIYQQLIQTQKIEFEKLQDYSSFIDDDPIDWFNWIQIFPLIELEL